MGTQEIFFQRYYQINKSKLIFINKQLSHPLCSQLIKQDTKSLAHKRINISKVPKKLKNDENVNTSTVPITQSQQDMELDEANKEAAEINEDVEMKPEIQLNEIIDRPEVNEIDHEACLSKLFSLSDYPMFSFWNDGQTGENKVYIDWYGIYVSNQQENEDMYLDELQNKLNRGDVYIDKDNDEELADGENYLYSTSKNDGLFGYDLDPNSKESMYQNIIDNYKNIDIFYNYIDENILVEWPIAYIPFEGRIDKKSFQIILSETRPKNLIIVNSSPKKVDRIKDFVEDNKLNINVLYLKDNPLSFEIIKESDIIYIEPTLTNSNGLKLSSTYDSSIFKI